MIELKSAKDKSNFINNLVKESFYNKMKLKDGISFNSILSGEKISFSVYNNFGIIVYESFNNIDSLKELLNESNKTEREQFIYNLVTFLLDVKDGCKLYEDLQEPLTPDKEPEEEQQEVDTAIADENDEDSELDNIHSGNMMSTIGTFLRPNVPKIYAFTTKYVPDAIKIGFTTKSAQQRLDQWREKYDDAQLIHWWPATLLLNNIKSYFKDFPVHEETIQQGFVILLNLNFQQIFISQKNFLENFQEEKNQRN